MPIKKYKPLTPGRRQMTAQDFSMVTSKKPDKSLSVGQKSNAGRSSSGRISVRHQGGGVKRKFRLVSFKRPEGTEAKVISIEYDPNRSARIALIQFATGQKQYIIAPENLKANQVISTDQKSEMVPGNRLELSHIPVGTLIHDIELLPQSRGQVCRAAGTAAALLAIDERYAMIKMPSGEIRRFLSTCKATIGQVSNIHHNQVVIGKAGRKRLMGIRPTVRGKAMYPAAHPHGGGEGNTSIGLKSPKTKWGVKALGIKTRAKHLTSNQLIIRRRKKKR